MAQNTWGDLGLVAPGNQHLPYFEALRKQQQALKNAGYDRQQIQADPLTLGGGLSYNPSTGAIGLSEGPGYFYNPLSHTTRLGETTLQGAYNPYLLNQIDDDMFTAAQAEHKDWWDQSISYYDNLSDDQYQKFFNPTWDNQLKQWSSPALDKSIKATQDEYTNRIYQTAYQNLLQQQGLGGHYMQGGQDFFNEIYGTNITDLYKGTHFDPHYTAPSPTQGDDNYHLILNNPNLTDSQKYWVIQSNYGVDNVPDYLKSYGPTQTPQQPAQNKQPAATALPGTPQQPEATMPGTPEPSAQTPWFSPEFETQLFGYIQDLGKIMSGQQQQSTQQMPYQATPTFQNQTKQAWQGSGVGKAGSGSGFQSYY